MPGSLIQSVRFLRAVLWFDAATGLLLGSLHLFAAPLLAQWLELPSALLRSTGVMLLGYAALAAFLAASPVLSRRCLLVLILGNAAWALASLAVLVGVTPPPSLLGQAYLLMHAVAVATLAGLQWSGRGSLPRAHPPSNMQSL